MPRFTKPTPEEVKARGLQIGLPPIQCEMFHDYYESNGWRVGKNPMKVWTAALANWKRHWQERYGQRTQTATTTYVRPAGEADPEAIQREHDREYGQPNDRTEPRA
jgi:hypothetical protein